MSAKQRMVRSAAYLFRERGYSGTGFRDVIAHSGAPRGSIYHHFPGGKVELAVEAMRYAGDFIAAGTESAISEDPRAAMRAFIGWWRQVLLRSGFQAGCPITAVTIESHEEAPQLAEAAAAAFRRWRETLATGLVSGGCPPARAATLATLIVSAVEGATILCRAAKTTDALDDVATELEALVRTALDNATTPPPPTEAAET
ncbi:TetR/AcrR family transcriptional regulator [Actinocorallia sp. A-T 12471]|uniref:TetR/AcrR family transcriptional regulator n=1 Tax=Actinocorallia sp. A-T 12471 TaxID=3089813 RepID=UPI0029CD125C|nr:TetR/AcrR family transcriptional regulator [Actinocorallia sp. A-T 12471]MDX6743093.1 TetR/AcrR family transcriptional regulator [Actinocorallia sp. A-T 12471]